MAGLAPMVPDREVGSGYRLSTHAKIHSIIGPLDSVVFGVGPAASIFAIERRRQGHHVLMVPPQSRIRRQAHGETLSPRGHFLLASRGLHDVALANQYETTIMLSCWHTASIKNVDFSLDPHGGMWHIERSRFDESLISHAIALGVQVLSERPWKVSSLKRQGAVWEIRLATPETELILRSEYLVDATGKSHSIARMMGARRIERDRLVSLFVSSESTGPVAPLLVEAVSEGWWYSLGLPDGKLIVGLITDPRVSRLAGETGRLFFDRMLSEAHETRDRGITVPVDIFLTNAETSRLDRMSGDGWFAIGDAAMSFDPLSSHGLCSAIEQSIEAAQIMDETPPDGFARMDEHRQLLYREYRRQRSLFYMEVDRFSSFPFWVNRKTA